MKKSKFSGYRVAVGAALYFFCILGIGSMVSVVYAMLPEHFGVTFTQLATGMSLCSVIGFFGGMVAVKVIQKLTPRGCMVLGGVLALCYALCSAFIKSYFGFMLAEFFFGLAAAFCFHGVISELIIRWFVKDCATIISLVISAGTFGGAAYQFIAGQIVDKLGVSKLYVVFGLFTFAVCVLSALLLVRNRPEELGQTALGAEEAAASANAVEASGAAASSAGSQISLYKKSSFWILLLAGFLGYECIGMVGTYTTTFLPIGGTISFATAATFVSIMTLVGGVAGTFGGKLLDKLGLKAYIMIVFLSAAVCNLGFVLFGVTQSVAALGVILLGYALGYAYSYISNLITVPLFGVEQATSANTKMLAMVYAGQMVLAPVNARIMELFGFHAAYIIMAACSILVMVLYLLAIRLSQKQAA